MYKRQPLKDPVIAPIDRTIKKKDMEEIVVCSISLKSSNVGPITLPHRPYILCNLKMTHKNGYLKKKSKKYAFLTSSISVFHLESF